GTMADTDDRGFEVIEFVEPEHKVGQRYTGPIETELGTFETEVDAIAFARDVWKAHIARDKYEVAWWIVRVPGEQLARWIADSRSDVEKVLDLTTRQLVPLKR
ncbi:MAG: hypothetical protein KJN71_03075, partial [Acidimicrobiia bacterium]|nr:hypothetical protein [Acidimicrobiia bacterium]